MSKKVLRDLYCYLCSLQFEKKCIYDLHTSIIHKYREKTESIVKKAQVSKAEVDLIMELLELGETAVAAAVGWLFFVQHKQHTNGMAGRVGNARYASKPLAHDADGTTAYEDECGDGGE